MNAPLKVKAIVRDGYIVVQEPTDLPNGTVVHLVDEDPYSYLDDVDDMDDEDRAKLHVVLENSWAERQAGKTLPIEGLLAELKRP